MNILCISDTHTKHNKIPKEWLLPADTIIHAGDISSRGYLHEIENFLKWFDSLDYTNKIFIAGNHDFGFQKFNSDNDSVMSLLQAYPNITYLMDSFVVIDGIKIYGSPWQPEFYNWAFNLKRGKPLADKWSLIPLDTDILITHGPVNGLLDMTLDGQFVGCEELLDVVSTKLNLKAHICGHIHCGYGTAYRLETTFVNASTLNERYEVMNRPIMLEITK